jgi:hypothetical protein
MGRSYNVPDDIDEDELLAGACLHSFPIQLNMSSSVHRITRLSS